jgi:(1->4)-alpha-D-glucan 1-alpha-D-glucosylmutase
MTTTTRAPVATYRLQLHPGFSFDAVERAVPYLTRLGVSHIYSSPIFAARPGSTHGYDVIDMTRVNPELGGREGFDRLAETVAARGLSWLQDVVPNHSAFHGKNGRLMDVLELGPHSRFYSFYDILWDHPYENIKGKILAPFLGDFYARCLERGELALSYREQGFCVSYYDFALPISLRSYRSVLCHDLMRLTSGPRAPALPRLMALIKFIDNLDAEIAAKPDFDYAPFIKEVLWELYSRDDAVRAHVDDNIAAFNGGDGEQRSYDLLDALLGEQYFRLSYWKVGTEELNYRRFFSINDLISLRVEDPEVFEQTHGLLFELIEAGRVQGVRVDHVDGLYDPTGYLERLRARFPRLYIAVEKILEPGEELPADWPVQGTTGYDFLDAVGALLAHGRAARALERTYRSFSKLKEPYAAIVRDNKRNIVGKHMAGDVDNLALLLKGITNRSREGNDLTMYAVRRALVEILTLFPIYRTYVSQERFSDQDLAVFREVFDAAQRTAQHFKNELELIGGAVERAHAGGLAEPEHAEWVNFIMRLQQYTGPVMAKGVEDSAFYIYNRLVARNEVGCDPSQLGRDLEAFHGFNHRRVARWPLAMNATATHDTKRGEDTRARIAAISWDPEAWKEGLARWSKANRQHKTRVGRRECPSPNDEYLIYQTVLGAAPFEGLDADDFGQRLEAYLVKATREAKLETSWLNPDARYEEALLTFARRILDPGAGAAFLELFLPYLERVAHLGVFASLAQTLLKLTCPGVPDLYQGTELWDLSLVDPDNRRPVDFDRRARLLEQLVKRLEQDRDPLLAELCADPRDGRVKLLLVHELLRLRRERPAVFLEGRYEPLLASGEHGERVVAFARTHGEDCVVVVALRLVNRLGVEPPSLAIDPAAWGDTTLRLPWSPRPRWTARFSGAELEPTEAAPLGQLVGPLPLAVLTNW